MTVITTIAVASSNSYSQTLSINTSELLYQTDLIKNIQIADINTTKTGYVIQFKDA